MLPIAIDTLATTSFRREENRNHFTINPKLVKAKDTLYRPFIPSDSLTLDLLRKGLGIPVIQSAATPAQFAMGHPVDTRSYAFV